MLMKLIALVTIDFIQMAWSQIAFPIHIELRKDKINLAGRLPLYTPARCGDNELLYPGDQRNDWICDCEPGAIYHPDSDACFPAFRRGPCANEEYLILSNASAIPICVRNDCVVDGQVKVKGACYKLGQAGPCQSSHLDLYILGVNPNALNVDCMKLSIERRFAEEPDAKLLCKNRGSKKFIEGHCSTTQPKAS